MLPYNTFKIISLYSLYISITVLVVVVVSIPIHFQFNSIYCSCTLKIQFSYGPGTSYTWLHRVSFYSHWQKIHPPPPHTINFNSSISANFICVCCARICVWVCGAAVPNNSMGKHIHFDQFIRSKAKKKNLHKHIMEIYSVYWDDDIQYKTIG